MVELAGVVEQIVASNVPLLFPDACSLLDLLRAPSRDLPFAHLSAALHLADKAELQVPELIIVTAQQVHDETTRHIEDVKKEGQLALEKHDARTENLVALLNIMGIKIATDEVGSVGYQDAVDKLVARYLATTGPLNDVPWEPAAIRRMRDRRAPASRGTQLADCIIFESFLGLVNTLRASGYEQKAIFLTSNKSDFADRVRAVPHADIAPELAAVSADLCFTFPSARYSLFPR